MIRGTYRQFAAKGLIDHDTAGDIQAVSSPRVTKNTTPALSEAEAKRLLHAPDTTTAIGNAYHESARDKRLQDTCFAWGFVWLRLLVRSLRHSQGERLGGPRLLPHRIPNCVLVFAVRTLLPASTANEKRLD